MARLQCLLKREREEEVKFECEVESSPEHTHTRARARVMYAFVHEGGLMAGWVGHFSVKQLQEEEEEEEEGFRVINRNKFSAILFDIT